MQKGCAEGIMFFTPRQKLARIRHKLSLQLWLARGKIARNKGGGALKKIGRTGGLEWIGGRGGALEKEWEEEAELP